MKVVITGGSGMVGRGVLLECLDHEKIREVISIGRSEIDLSHPKLTQIVHKDFSDYNPIQDQLQNVDAAYLNMGISAVGLSEAQYKEITYDYTLALAKQLLELNPNMTCTYVSGVGTDSTEKGRTMWARVKGKTENDLLKLGFKQAFMFRRNHHSFERDQSKTNLYQFFYDYFLWLIKFFKLIFPKSIVNTTQIGLAMIHVTLRGYDKKILAPSDILKASK